MSKIFNVIIWLNLIFVFGCIQKQERSALTSLGRVSGLFNIQNVSVNNNQLIIRGGNLSKIKTIAINNNSQTINETMMIESQSDSQIIANGLRNINFVSETLLNLVLSTAEASSVYTINFSVSNGSITAAMLSSMGASKGQVMKYNGTSWVPSSLTNAQTYLGTWNASTNSPDLTIPSSTPGDFFIVSVAGTFNSVSYAVGDWIISDGYNWDKVANSSVVVSSFNNRRGAVSLVPADYVLLKDPTTQKITGSSLNDLANVDLTSIAPTNGNSLLYNSSSGKWYAGTPNFSIAAGSITDSEISSTANIAQSKISGLVTALSSKETALTIGTTNQFLRGDKTWQTLDTSVVPENTNLYFTNARTLGVPLTGLSNLNSEIFSTDNLLVAFGKAQGQINAHTASLNSQSTLIGNKADTWNPAQTITALVITGLSDNPMNGLDAVNKNYVDTQANVIAQWTQSNGNVYRPSGNVGISVTNPIVKLDVGGAIKVGVDVSVCTSSFSGAIRFNSPNVEYCNGSIWTPLMNSASVISTVNGNPNLLTLTTSNISEGTNLYYTNARVIASTITTPALSNTQISSGDKIQDAFGKLQAQVSAREPIIPSGNNTQYLRGDKSLSVFIDDVLNTTLKNLTIITGAILNSSDTILSAINKLHIQIISNATIIGTKADSSNNNQTIIAKIINAAAVTGLQNPTLGTDAANKDYVDSKTFQNIILTNTTASGGWTTPSTITTSTRFKITLIGAGGGGGGAKSASNIGNSGVAGGGGGAGAVNIWYVSGLSPNTSYSYTIGVGGIGGGSTGAASNGNSGGSTSITINGVNAIANGGGGGGFSISTTATGPGGTGGISSNGTFSINGVNGGEGYSYGGMGGSTILGNGQPGKSYMTSSNGSNGTGYGSGGSGATSADMMGYTGGSGAPGAILIEYIQ